MIIIGPSEDTAGIEGYTSRELRRVFCEHLHIELPAYTPVTVGDHGPIDSDMIVLGTCDNNPVLRQLLQEGLLPEPTQAQGYAIRCGPHPADARRKLLAIAGADPAGALYALRDIEHYHLASFRNDGGRLVMEPFERAEYPRIEYRGHWVWGCNMPDKPAWIENMSRWKLNELIHWDNYPPERAREYVDFAHERGVRVVWGFGWGWVPEWNYTLPAEFDRGQGDGVEMCSSNPFNREFLRREILRKVREEYAPTGCDGIYFQAFTECPKCQCPRCADRTMGELMLDFVNPIVDDLQREFPHLWISCGIHHDFGDFSYLKSLDPRCNVLWENCEAGTSVRGEDEDFGYLYKSIPYGHGYSATCPADPSYTEASLQEWMAGNAHLYTLNGGWKTHCQYLEFMQNWGRRFLGKRSTQKHAGVVADHAVFCRRTPFPHVALAEAQWNPERDTEATVDGLLTFLGMKETVEQTPDPDAPLRDSAGKPPWLCDTESVCCQEGHTE
ncbi:MAG: hypothetical protein ACYDBB_11960 [Armatimonadota bacterium]